MRYNLANNVGVTPGTGAAIWTDETASGHKQMVGVVDATEDSVNRMKVNTDGSINVIESGVNTAGTDWAVSVGTVTPVLLPTTPLVGRKVLNLENLGAFDLYVSFSNAAGLATRGTRIASGQSSSFSIGPSLNLYGLSVGGTNDVRGIELA